MKPGCSCSESNKPKSVLLYSGGFDSFVQSFLLNPDILLYFDIRGHYSKAEVRNLMRSKHYAKVIIDSSLVIGGFEQQDYYLPFRNPMFILTSLQYGQHVMLGINKHDNAVDKNQKFLTNLTRFIRGMVNARNDSLRYFPETWVSTSFSITAPYHNLTKEQVLRLAIKRGIDVDGVRKIRTCYDGSSKKGCGKCPPCLQKADALVKNSISIKGLFDSDPSSLLKDEKIISKYL